MGPGIFIIAILGCGDDASNCRQVASGPAYYESREACAAATGGALMANSDLDFPTLFAECRPAARKASSPRPEAQPEGGRRA